jgi:hypothetical protein
MIETPLPPNSDVTEDDALETDLRVGTEQFNDRPHRTFALTGSQPFRPTGATRTIRVTAAELIS